MKAFHALSFIGIQVNEPVKISSVSGNAFFAGGLSGIAYLKIKKDKLTETLRT